MTGDRLTRWRSGCVKSGLMMGTIGTMILFLGGGFWGYVIGILCYGYVVEDIMDYRNGPPNR